MSYPAPASPFAAASAPRAPFPGVRPMPPRPGTAPAPVAGAPAAGPYAAQANRYREAELSSATPGQLVVLLFDKMALTLRRARTAIEQRDIETRTESILKASDMITELKLSLDHAAGGEISRQLDALYGFMLRELFDANRQQSVAKLDAVLGIAGELREAFHGANAQLAAQAAEARAAAVAGGGLQVRSA